ncbi:hypothetical protein ACHAXT_013102 [Thalassiosira profunda]
MNDAPTHQAPASAAAAGSTSSDEVPGVPPSSSGGSPSGEKNRVNAFPESIPSDALDAPTHQPPASSNSSNAFNKMDPFPDPPAITNPTALETSQWWAEMTSIHGMPYMLDRGHFRRWKQFAWTTFVLFMAGALTWAIVAEFQDFGKYNVDTSTKTIIPSSLGFPRVTICNANGGIDADLQNATGIEEPTNEAELMAISQPLGEFIWYTQMNDEVYETEAELATVWTPVVTPLGLCFSFTTEERVFVPGISSGLVVYTWLDQDAYPAAATWAGVRVFVTPNAPSNDNGTAISHQTAGVVLVPPGAVSFVAVTRQDFQREEDDPWSNCLPDGEGIDRCRVECIMAATSEKCGCRIVGDGRDASLPYCTSADEICSSSVGDEDLAVCTSCSIPPCKEQVYGAHYSAGRISQNAEERAQATMNATPGEVADNFVAIHVNFDSIRYEETTESKSTSVWQLFSNLGGSFGFFMGISLISIVELFVELLGLRLMPRLWGKKQLYGIGQRKFD